MGDGAYYHYCKQATCECPDPSGERVGEAGYRTEKGLVIYNKLVRDNMPEVIAANGNRAAFRTLSEDEYLHELCRKLMEEVLEFLEDRKVSELADVFAVVSALAECYYGDGLAGVARLEAIKKDVRGGFDNRLFLLYGDAEDVRRNG